LICTFIYARKITSFSARIGNRLAYAIRLKAAREREREKERERERERERESHKIPKILRKYRIEILNESFQYFIYKK
jgi:hypothetical protein